MPITHQQHTEMNNKKRQRAQNAFAKRIDIELKPKNEQVFALTIEFYNARAGHRFL